MQKLCSVKEEIYTHEYLWRSSTALARRLDIEADDQHHLLLPTLLTTFMAYEAFINFSGFVVLPDLWSDEKTNFKGKTLEDKVKAIAAALPKFVWQKVTRPYKTVGQLSKFRDLVAHGKVQVKQYIAAQQPDGSHFQFEHAWDEHLTCEAVLAARADVKAFCQELLEAMRCHSDHPHLVFDAFDGSLASGESSSNVG